MRKKLGVATLTIGSLAWPFLALAQDPNSLTATRQGAAVELRWSDATPSLYCARRAIAKLPPLPIVGSSTATTWTDAAPPAAPVVFYDITESSTGSCSGSICAPIASLACGSVGLAGDTTSTPGATDALDSYPGCGVPDADGPELAWQLTPPVDLSITVSISTAVPGLDLFLIEDSGSGCAPADCRVTGDTSLQASLVAGRSYWLLVDGRGGSAGAFTLDVDCSATACAAARTLDCTSRTDSFNNGNGTSLLRDYAPCAGQDLTGPEVIYSFTAPAAGAANFALSGLTADLDLFLLEDLGAGCATTSCNAQGDLSLNYTLTAGRSYYIVVDGRNRAVSDYTLTLTCPAAAPGCSAGAGTLACGARISGDTTASGSSSQVSDWSPCAATDLTGREVVYTFRPSRDEDVTLALSNIQIGQDLDLVVLREQGSGCEPTACFASGDSQVGFTALANVTYYIVVDGRSGSAGTFDLALDCTVPRTCQPVGGLLCGGGSRLGDTSTDPNATDVNDAYPCAPGRDLSGPEVAFDFLAPADGGVTFEVMSSADLDVLVLDNDGNCDPSSCLAWGDTRVVFTAVAGRSYRLVVDGVAGASGPYVARISSCPPNPGTCNAVETLSCGPANRRFGDTSSFPGTTDVNDGYSCAAGRDATGQEYTYLFSPPTSSAGYRVKALLENVSPASADPDVYALEDQGGGCSSSDCIAWGDLEATFDAAAGGVYYLAVDSRAGAEGGYSIWLDCTAIPGQCNPSTPLTCGQTLASQRNDQPGSTDVIDTYQAPCRILNPLDESGPEVAYRFVAASTGNATVTIANNPLALHLFVLPAASSVCDADTCRFFSTSGSLTFPTTAGTTYDILVEGFQGNVSGYDVSLGCN